MFGFEDVVLKSIPDNSIKIGGYVPILHNKKTKWVTILIWSSKKMIGECLEVLNTMKEVAYQKEIFEEMYGNEMKNICKNHH